MNQFALFDAPGGTLIADYSHKVQDLTVATNERGFAEAHGFIPMGLAGSFLLYDRAGLPHCVFSDNATSTIHEGRLEDVEIVTDGIKLSAFGYARALGDAPYTALWSVSGVSGWLPITTSDVATRTPERYQMDTNNRLFMAPQKNATYANTGLVGEFHFTPPNGGSRKIIGLQFDYEMLMPVNWQLIASSWNTAWTRTNLATINATGALQTGSILLQFTADDRVGIALFFNAAAALYAGETGANYVKATNIRVVTSTANWVNTTLTANRAAGTNVTATVGSTANMYVGQRLTINTAGAPSESVTVLSIGGSNQFNATFVNNYVIGNGVNGFRVVADEIAKDLISTINTLNSTQLSSSTALVQSPGLDLLNESYEDQLPSDILTYLVGLGDNQTPPRQWEWGVKEGRQLYFQPQNSASRTWYIDLSDIDINRTIDQIANSVYAVYQDANDRTLRTATASDSLSITRYGLTRRASTAASTTSNTQASVQRDAALADGKDPKPRSGVVLTRVYDGAGARWPLWYVRAGDTVIIRNLPPTLSTSIDRIRIFRLTRTEYHANDDAIQIEPDVPRPTLEALLARLAIGLKS